jgi:hypothetical protein
LSIGGRHHEQDLWFFAGIFCGGTTDGLKSWLLVSPTADVRLVHRQFPCGLTHSEHTERLQIEPAPFPPWEGMTDCR